MKLELDDLPLDHEEWPRWLEGRICDPSLAELVAELRGVVREPSSDMTLNEACGGKLNSVIKNGFTALDSAAIGNLLTHPELLFELYDEICFSVSPYWEPKLLQTSATEPSRSTKRSLSGDEDQGSERQSRTSSRTNINSHKKLAAWVLENKATATLATLAATVILVLGIWSQMRSSQHGWGFDQPGLLSQDVTARRYLSNLSDAAGQWSNKRPSNAHELEKRISEFRHGCGTLIAATHAPLADADKNWLIDKCKGWAVELDSHLAELRRDTGSYREVLNKADETINRLQNALKERALKLS